MPHDIPTYLHNRSLGLGTSKTGYILPKPTSVTQSPSFLDFSLENFEDRTIYQKDVVGHYGCINAIEFSPNEELVASGGDDRRIVIWAADELLYNREPKMRGKMKRQHCANIFSLGFDPDSKVVYSAGNDHFFVSSDISTGEQLYGVQGRSAIHDISVNKRSGEVMVTRSGGPDALLFHDPRTNRATASITPRGQSSIGPYPQLFSSQYNPDPSSFLIGICGENFGVRFIDRRNLLKPLFSRDPSRARKSAMYGGWNKNGTKFAHLVAKKAPVVYDFKECVTYETAPSTYRNQHTVKSIEWIDDDWLLTGSDNFNIYGWCTRNLPDQHSSLEVEQESDTRFKVIELPEKESPELLPKACLIGHRSVVNHVRFSSRYQFLVSSGVEKIIKVWNTRFFPASSDKPRLRRRGTAESANEEGQGDNSWPRRLAPFIFQNDEPERRRNGNIERRRRRRTDESGRMLRYFDRLVSGEPSDEDIDSDSSDDSFDDSDDERPAQPGLNRFVEDTDERDGVENIPETRVFYHKGESSLNSDARDWRLEFNPMESDESDDNEDNDDSDREVDVSMSEVGSNPDEDENEAVNAAVVDAVHDRVMQEVDLIRSLFSRTRHRSTSPHRRPNARAIAFSFSSSPEPNDMGDMSDPDNDP